jgi:hypothetical protein
MLLERPGFNYFYTFQSNSTKSASFILSAKSQLSGCISKVLPVINAVTHMILSPDFFDDTNRRPKPAELLMVFLSS